MDLQVIISSYFSRLHIKLTQQYKYPKRLAKPKNLATYLMVTGFLI